jgi:hypothetical protein
LSASYREKHATDLGPSGSLFAQILRLPLSRRNPFAFSVQWM